MARAEHVAERMAERIGRWMLACAIAGTVPLALWGGACGKRPVVEPRPDGGGSGGSGVDGASDTTTDVAPVDRPYAVDLVGTDVGDAPEAADQTFEAGPDSPAPDAAAGGCCTNPSTNQCSADGRSLLACDGVMTPCVRDGGAGYGYVWRTQACADGCVTDSGDGAVGDAGAGARCRTIDANVADLPLAPDSANDRTAGDLLIDLATDPAGQDFPSVPDAAPGCCAEMTPGLCSADGRSLIMCRIIFGQCNPVGLYGYMWFTQACDNGCFTEGPDGQSGDGGSGPRCR